MKRIVTFLLCLALMAGTPIQNVWAAPEWPSRVSVSAEGAVLMDAYSGAVLYDKNMHAIYYPASITKVLTALVVLEYCNLDDIVTFSRTAIHSVESGSSSADIDVGDQLSVRDCLYAMMLKSANEVANGLAEYTAGSIEDFVSLMNAKAKSLGCRDSHFNNPSGLNDPYHYTSAYDMALITQAAFQNETFVAIDSSLYYDLPPTKRNPDGLRIYPGHRMMKKNDYRYYPGIIGGKTGYTSLAGNTLVTCAQRDNMKLIVVVLNGHNTHYTDTTSLLNFGFSNFRSLNVADLDTTYSSIANDMTIAGLHTTDLSTLHMQENCRITLPNSADFSDTGSIISYDLSDAAPEDAIARITYEYEGRQIGATYLIHNENRRDSTKTAIEVTASSEPEPDEGESEEDAQKASSSRLEGFRFHIPARAWIILGTITALIFIIGGLIFLKRSIDKREQADRATRCQRRQQRLKEIGMSTADFHILMQKKRFDSSLSREKSKHRPRPHKSFLDKKR